MNYVYTRMDSPVGTLKLVAGNGALVAILWQGDRRRFPRLEQAVEDPANPVLVEAGRQLRDYFAGRRKTFSLPLAFEGTPFQQAVWNALLTIPHGEVRTYGQIARQIGKPAAVRAVGAANGMNPISIVAPCHRVVGANGALTGFAGGLDAKAHLLALEGARPAATEPPAA
jgi:methylated-DNA-[protein]-cysteine S-methyltransferase